ncbi:hypothetical protein ScPMuIL_012482 [Solemya velum]
MCYRTGVPPPDPEDRDMPGEISPSGNRGWTYGLSCIQCSSVENEDCVDFPFDTDKHDCGLNANGLTFMCQTHGIYHDEDRLRKLVSVTRRCTYEHEHCNKPCYPNSTQCWLCCNNGDMCNSYPLKTLAVSQANAIYFRNPISGFVIPLAIVMSKATRLHAGQTSLTLPGHLVSPRLRYGSIRSVVVTMD